MSSDLPPVEPRPGRALRLSNESVVRIEADGRARFETWNASAAALFAADTKLALSSVDGVLGRKLNDAKEVARALKWQADRSQHVFLDDDLDSAIALDDLFRGRHGNFTALGELEAFAKATADEAACDALATVLASFVRSTPLYADCVICAVPPDPRKDFDLPTTMVALVAAELEVENISERVRLRTAKKPLKALPLADKRTILDRARIDLPALAGRAVLMIDDKYQSGTTANWVGQALRRAGAPSVHGLFLVKTWRSRDNMLPPGDFPD